jgi:hypothetical protein
VTSERGGREGCVRGSYVGGGRQERDAGQGTYHQECGWSAVELIVAGMQPAWVCSTRYVNHSIFPAQCDRQWCCCPPPRPPLPCKSTQTWSPLDPCTPPPPLKNKITHLQVDCECALRQCVQPVQLSPSRPPHFPFPPSDRQCTGPPPLQGGPTWTLGPLNRPPPLSP